MSFLRRLIDFQDGKLDFFGIKLPQIVCVLDGKHAECTLDVIFQINRMEDLPPYLGDFLETEKK